MQLFVVDRQTLDGDDVFSFHAGERCNTTALRPAVDMYRTGTALADPTSKLGTG
jgi:hypothetical protein